MNLIPKPKPIEGEVVDNKLWRVIPQPDGYDATLELESIEKAWSEVDGSGGRPAYKAYITWDGCCHLWLLGLAEKDDDYLHLDDIDSLINHLVELRERGKKQFNNEWWPNE